MLAAAVVLNHNLWFNLFLFQQHLNAQAFSTGQFTSWSPLPRIWDSYFEQAFGKVYGKILERKLIDRALRTFRLFIMSTRREGYSLRSMWHPECVLMFSREAPLCLFKKSWKALSHVIKLLLERAFSLEKQLRSSVVVGEKKVNKFALLTFSGTDSALSHLYYFCV